jgi:hypothetical protein
MYVYIQSEPGLWTVGFYDPKGGWQAESDWGSASDAASRANWLNGAAAMKQSGLFPAFINNGGSLELWLCRLVDGLVAPVRGPERPPASWLSAITEFNTKKGS